MGGVRTAGDLVMRMQIAKKMRINEAKKFVADKLGLTIEEISDVVTMAEVRDEKGFGLANFEPYAVQHSMEAKFRLRTLESDQFRERSRKEAESSKKPEKHLPAKSVTALLLPPEQPILRSSAFRKRSCSGQRMPKMNDQKM
jgi:dimethylamine--corrinoid protein Co-methyltransferase